MELTLEQEDVVNMAMSKKEPLLKVAAVAGSGKTATLLELARRMSPKKALYTAFNKAIVQESSLKFPSTIECRTLHSLAYNYIIRGSNRKVDSFTYACIKEPVVPAMKVEIVKALNGFFQSGDINMGYFEREFPPGVANLARKYLGQMVDGVIPCTFGFLLKYFLLQLKLGNLDGIEPYELIMLDEAGDVTEVTLEIFKLLPAEVKVMVGDPLQNIYTFMNTVNGFTELADEGMLLRLSTTFRVTAKIARHIESYCQAVLDRSMDFRGLEIVDKEINTKAYIARTNAGLINRMIVLNRTNTKYNLIRNPVDIFALPITLLTLKPDRLPNRREFRWIYYELLKYNKTPDYQMEHSTFFKYLAHEYSEDHGLVRALKLLRMYAPSVIWDTYNKAKALWDEGMDSQITLATAHASKGLTFDAVTIEEDMNKIILSIIEAGGAQDEDELAELRLGYVAATRCRIRLHNAKFLSLGAEDYEEYNQ